MENSRRH